MNFDKNTDRLNTNSYKWEKYGPTVLPMWVADMDFEASEPIQKAVNDVAQHGIYGYSTIPQKLIDCIIERLEKKHEWKINPEWIVCLPGLVPGLFTVSNLYPHHTVGIHTAVPVYHHFLFSANQQIRHDIPFIWNGLEYELDFDTFEKQIDKRSKFFFLCNPHNPNGKVFSEAELIRLADICLKNNIVICSDEIHCDLILDESKKHISIARLSPEIEQNTITLLSPSKTFNIAGLGFSFAVVPNDKLRSDFQKKIFGVQPMISSFAYEAAYAAYQHSGLWHSQLLDYLRANHDLLLNNINGINGLEMRTLSATYLAWVNFERLGKKGLTDILLSNGIGVQDGKGFGLDSHFRLNFATQKQRLLEGIAIIKDTVNNKL